MSDDHSDMPLVSDDVQEIMNHIPGWLVRWGITAVFLTLAVLLFVSWMIRYPDVISARVTIVSTTPPVSAIARSSGPLLLHVQDKAAVTAGTVLASIGNPARLEDVFALKRALLGFTPFFADPACVSNMVFDRAASLGELQASYAGFLEDLTSYQLILSHAAGGVQAPRYGDFVSDLVRQKVVTEKEVEVAEMKYKSSRTLFDKGLMAEVELAEAERAFHEKKATLDYVNAEIGYVRNKLVLSIQLMYKRLESQLAEWEHKYLLEAPIDGEVSFFQFWNNNQFVRTGDEVMTIVPRSTSIVGKMLLPVAGSGKVQRGQTVYIRCDSYPYREYGSLRGTVAAMSLTPRNDQYLVQVELPGGLHTTFDKALEFRQDMNGTALVITRDVRLIQRIFHEFRYLFSSATM